MAHQEQDFNREWSLPFSGNRDYSIRIDVNETLPYLDTPNPNVGRPLIATNWGNMSTTATDREALRATAYYQLDFTERSDAVKWLGNHVLTGFYNEQKIDRMGGSFNGRYTGVDFDYIGAVTQRSINNFRNNSNIWQYLGPSYLNDASIQSKDDIQITNTANVPAFTDGQEFTVA